MKLIPALVFAAVVALAQPALGQAPAAPQAAPASASAADMEKLKAEIRADKKQLVADNMQLTEAEAKAFWPVYDAYQKRLAALNERTKKMITEYADAYGKGALAAATAKKLRNEAIAIEEAEAKLKRDFAPRLDQAVGVVKAVRYQQIENKIRAIIKYELADGIPLAD